jgi:3-deoxy-7-phosphoheptulonate synthase
VIIVMQSKAAKAQVDEVVGRIKDLGLKPHVSHGEFRTIIGAIGDESLLRPESFAGMAGVEKVMPIMKSYKLASRDFNAADTVLEVGPVRIGGDCLAVVAGPCSVESERQLRDVARATRDAGAALLRGGAPGNCRGSARRACGSSGTSAASSACPPSPRSSTRATWTW